MSERPDIPARGLVPYYDQLKAVLEDLRESASSSASLLLSMETSKQDANSSLAILSSTDRLDDNKRIRITSSQKQEAENDYNGGETVWLDLENPLAKAMISWRLRYDLDTRTVYGEGEAPSDAPYRSVVWAGAHWFAQNQVDDDNPTAIHGHWSVETPDLSGALHTRFQIFFNDRDDPTKIGSEVALISTNRADFMVQRQSNQAGTENWGRFVVAGAQNLYRGLEIARTDDSDAGRRWFVGANSSAESGSNVGGDLVLRRHADNGDYLATALYVRRSNGEVTIGSDAWAPASNPAQLFVPSPGGDQSSVVAQPVAALTNGAATFLARLTTADELAIRVRVGNNPSRFELRSDGRMSWGGGSGAVDTHLYRDGVAGRLKTDGELTVASNVRIGSATAAGAVGALAVANASVSPSGLSTAAFWLYSDGGRPKFLTRNGVVITLEQQSAVADATDEASAVTQLNALLSRFRTIGLIAI